MFGDGMVSNGMIIAPDSSTEAKVIARGYDKNERSPIFRFVTSYTYGQ
jgi:hypothetical protein